MRLLGLCAELNIQITPDEDHSIIRASFKNSLSHLDNYIGQLTGLLTSLNYQPRPPLALAQFPTHDFTVSAQNPTVFLRLTTALTYSAGVITKTISVPHTSASQPKRPLSVSPESAAEESETEDAYLSPEGLDRCIRALSFK